MKIMLLNDNATLGHAGCQAVSDAIARRIGELRHTIVSRFFLGEVYQFRRSDPQEGIAAVLADAEICERINDADVVLCNGEGSIHHGAGTELLAVLGAAQRLGKPTLLFNAVFEDTPGWESILGKLSDFTVRDHRSLAYAKSLGIAARFVPDISLEAKYVLDKQISLAGKDVLTDWHPLRTDVEAIIRGYASERTATEKVYLPFHSRDTAEMWRSLPSMLSDCRVLLTARHHGAYMAALCGCPFVLLGSNTHKMEGILDMFPGLPFCRRLDDLSEAIEYAVSNKALFTAFAHTLGASLPLSHFEMLGKGDAEPSAERELNRLDLDLSAKRNKVFSDAAMVVEQRSAEFLHARARAHLLNDKDEGVSQVDLIESVHAADEVFRHYLNERATRLIASKVIKQGDTVLDCGANVGYHTTDFAGRVGEEGKVHAFEPNPDLWQHFIPLKNVRLWPVAVGNKVSVENFILPLGYDQVGSLVDARDFMGQDTPVRVMSVLQARIDDLTEVVERPISFIKIDVERHEAAALDGLRETLGRYKPVVVFENNTTETEAVLAEVGYKVVGMMSLVSAELKSANVAAVHESQIERLSDILPSTSELQDLVAQISAELNPPTAE